MVDFISSLVWFGFNKKLRFTVGVTSEKLQSRPIMTKLDPTQPSHMHSSMHFSFYLLIRHSKNENIKYIEKCQRYKRLNRKTEIFELECNQPVKHMVRQNLEANVLESRLKGKWKIVIIRKLLVREIFYGRRRQTSKT